MNYSNVHKRFPTQLSSIAFRVLVYHVAYIQVILHIRFSRHLFLIYTYCPVADNNIGGSTFIVDLKVFIFALPILL